MCLDLPKCSSSPDMSFVSVRTVRTYYVHRESERGRMQLLADQQSSSSSVISNMHVGLRAEDLTGRCTCWHPSLLCSRELSLVVVAASTWDSVNLHASRLHFEVVVRGPSSSSPIDKPLSATLHDLLRAASCSMIDGGGVWFCVVVATACAAWSACLWLSKYLGGLL